MTLTALIVREGVADQQGLLLLEVRQELCVTGEWECVPDRDGATQMAGVASALLSQKTGRIGLGYVS